jgi:hypothetical protein
MTRPLPYHLTRTAGRPRGHCVYELIGPDGIPVFCSYGVQPSPWLSWWLIREHLPDAAPIGRWLRYLDRPPALGWYFFGRTAISEAAAEALARHRIAELRQDFDIPLPYNRVRGQGSRPLVLVWPGGRQERYKSVSEAARVLGISRRQVLRHVDTGEALACGGLLVAL